MVVTGIKQCCTGEEPIAVCPRSRGDVLSNGRSLVVKPLSLNVSPCLIRPDARTRSRACSERSQVSSTPRRNAGCCALNGGRAEPHKFTYWRRLCQHRQARKRKRLATFVAKNVTIRRTSPKATRSRSARSAATTPTRRGCVSLVTNRVAETTQVWQICAVSRARTLLCSDLECGETGPMRIQIAVGAPPGCLSLTRGTSRAVQLPGASLVSGID
jgi:hypothetical protein